MGDKDLIKKAQSFCDEKGFRLTAPRLAVLKVFAASKKPMGAYDILEKMKTKQYQPNPPTIYRAIEFFEKHGFLHRIESLNSYVFCHAGHNHNGSQFVICDSCGDVQEIHLCQIPNDLNVKIESLLFKMSYWNTEIHGICKECKN